MPALGTVKMDGYKVIYWKFTWTATLPTGEVVHGDSYRELTEVLVRVIISQIMAIYNAGKKAQCNLIKKVLQIER